MEKRQSAVIMELVAGYGAYANSDELQVTAAGDAPETTVPCASFTVSFLTSRVVVRTVQTGC